MLKRLLASIFVTRIFNNPQLIHQLEDRIVNSPPVRELARIIAGLYQRGSWELKQIKSIQHEAMKIRARPVVDNNFSQKFKEFAEEIKKMRGGR